MINGILIVTIQLYDIILNLKFFHRPMSLSVCEQCAWKEFEQNNTLTGGMLAWYQTLEILSQICFISK